MQGHQKFCHISLVVPPHLAGLASPCALSAAVVGSLCPSTSQQWALDTPSSHVLKESSQICGKRCWKCCQEPNWQAEGLVLCDPFISPITSLSIHKSLYWTSLLVSCCPQFLTNAQLWWAFDSFFKHGSHDGRLDWKNLRNVYYKALTFL